MLHLFNSTYVYPDIVFNPTDDYIVVGKNYKVYGANVENSFYYAHTNKGECLGRFENYKAFIESGLLKNVVKRTTKVVIYSDSEEYPSFFAGLLKTQMKQLTKEFFLEASKIESIRMKTRAKIIKSDVVKAEFNKIANVLFNLEEIPLVLNFRLDETWVIENAGVEFKLMVGKTGNVKDLVDRYVYSHFDEARVKFLSRKEAVGWVINESNFNYETVASMEHLYDEMRKEVTLFTDTLIKNYYDTKDVTALIKDPQFLLLLSANKNMPDKINIWLLRLVMKMTTPQIQSLGILA
jgi:hypothetical protein